ncbi:hypothetical protein NDU88_002607 [Pleurodeles waltl]|uniref:Uncharacterized protein n=1 Tax=Pleurodeles waltl TaxID=8319 RepID=A0AAV7TL54_PLEWA|nr:hypothetical protein NDU88_002607 [Pleurodeles waltl]
MRVRTHGQQKRTASSERASARSDGLLPLHIGGVPLIAQGERCTTRGSACPKRGQGEGDLRQRPPAGSTERREGAHWPVPPGRKPALTPVVDLQSEAMPIPVWSLLTTPAPREVQCLPQMT